MRVWKAIRFIPIATLMICAISSGHALGLVVQQADGVWWQDLSSGQRGISMLGALDGYRNGWLNASIATESEAESRIKQTCRLEKLPPSSCSKFVEDASSAGESIGAGEGGHFSRFAIGRYVGDISDFYSAHPDSKDGITVGFILACESDKPFLDCKKFK
jgi:hypothetical protein